MLFFHPFDFAKTKLANDAKNILFKNGKTTNIDITPEVINDRTMVPVRVISESFGCNVEWDQDNLTVKITN